MENTRDCFKNVDNSYNIIIIYLFGFMFLLSLPCAFVDTKLMHKYLILPERLRRLENV